MTLIEKIHNYVKAKPNCNFLSIAKGLQIPFNKNQELTSSINKMLDENLLVKTRDQTFVAVVFECEIEGQIRFAQDGKFGFINIQTEDEEEKISYFVPSNNFNNSLSGDIVKAAVYKQLDGSEKTFASVLGVMERNATKISGVLELQNSYLSFKPLKKEFAMHKFIINEFKQDARINDVVIAKIKSIKDKIIEIDIIEKVSNVEDPLCYVKTLLSERELPKGFEKNVLDEANKIPDKVQAKDLKNRFDFRNDLVVTIDGDYTKDFDDAINVKKIDNKFYELAVHIADVSYYVQENSEIDKEALKRGTSTYLANQVIPMLPEKLSNGICSLNPNEDRLTMSIIIKIDNYGQTIDAKLVPGIINSKYRLTYNRVNEFIQNNKKFDNNELNKMLSLCYELTKKLRKVKNEEGYIDFEIEEPKIIFGEDNNIVDVVCDKSGESEKMIEDFMVRANEETAKILSKHKIPILYRVHESPSEEKLNYFKNVMNVLNIKVDIDSNNISPKSFQNTIEKIKQQRFDSFLQIMFLRAMSKAIYDPNNIGHFGLASEFYCHFTSPIRRYPDLMVHRAIRDVLFNNDRTKIEHLNKILPVIAKQNSDSEASAMQVERDTNDLLYASYFRDKIGQSFNCQIVSVVKFGVFVEFDNKTNALVHVSTMSDDNYQANFELTELVGEKTKNKYRLGDKVSVVITKTDPINGKVDACFVKNYADYYSNIKKRLNNDKKGKFFK